MRVATRWRNVSNALRLLAANDEPESVAEQSVMIDRSFSSSLAKKDANSSAYPLFSDPVRQSTLRVWSLGNKGLGPQSAM